jgi:hypothetical protein
VSALFPTPLSDELLYSVLARYQDRVRFPSQRAVLNTTFGRSTITAVVELPGRIGALLDRLVPGHSYRITDLVRHHTTLPYYARFVAPERVEDALHRMRATGGGGLAEILGIRASTVPTPTHLQFCPDCADHDALVCGEPYWRRAHQLPGVWVCPEHDAVLWRSTVRRRDAFGRHAFRSLSGVLGAGAPLVPPTGDHTLLRALAADTVWLLSGDLDSEGGSALRARYLAALESRGWMRSRLQVRVSDLREAFVAAYGTRTLAALGCQVRSETGEHDWLARLVRKGRAAQHPLHHLLLVRFLGFSARDFFAAAPPVHAAGSGGYAGGVSCPNPVCESARTGNRCAVSVRGTNHRCVACGFTFRPAREPGGRPQVLAYGEVWEARLRKSVADPSLSLRAVARELGVNAKTVQLQARRLRVWRPGWAPATKPSPTGRLTALEGATPGHKATWLRLRAEHPEDGVQALRARAPAAYSHLYRYVRAWLDQHRPPRPPAKRRAPRVDWPARDRDVAALVSEAAAAMLALPGRPVRLTRAALARRAGHASLIEQHLDRLPLVAEVLAAKEESRVAHGARKVRWATEQLAAEGTAVEAWTLERTAALRPDLAAQLADVIDEAVRRGRAAWPLARAG